MRGTVVSRARSTFWFAELFAGIGVMRLALETNGGSCMFTGDHDKFCLATYAANFPDDSGMAGDIAGILSLDIPDFDALLAGFPCQPFSIAGVSKRKSVHRPHGFACEAQGTLFFEVARVLAAKRSKAFLLENVKSLLTHDR